MAQVNETYIYDAAVTSRRLQGAQPAALKVLLGKPAHPRKSGNNHPTIKSG